MKCLFIFFSCTLAQLNETQKNVCPDNAIEYTEAKPPIVAEWDVFQSHWFSVTNAPSGEVNSFFLDGGLQNDVCLGLRYRMADPNVTFASDFLTGGNVNYDNLERPDWLESECEGDNCRIKLCCPIVTSRNTVSDDADCSDPSIGQFSVDPENPSTFAPTEKFWTHWFSTRYPGGVNPVFFEPGWRTDLCRGLRLKIAAPEFPFVSFIMGQNNGNFSELPFIPSSTEVRCKDKQCRKFEARICCAPFSDVIDEPVKQLNELIIHLQTYMTEIHETDFKFKEKLTLYLSRLEGKLKDDFLKKKKLGYGCGNVAEDLMRFTDFLVDDPCEGPHRLTNLLAQWTNKYIAKCVGDEVVPTKRQQFWTKRIETIGKKLARRGDCDPSIPIHH